MKVINIKLRTGEERHFEGYDYALWDEEGLVRVSKDIGRGVRKIVFMAPIECVLYAERREDERKSMEI